MPINEEKLNKKEAVTFFLALVTTGVFQKSIENNETGSIFYYLGDWKNLGLTKDKINALAYGYYHLVQNKYLVAVRTKGDLSKQADKPNMTRYIFIDDWNRMDEQNKALNFDVIPHDLVLKAANILQKN